MDAVTDESLVNDLVSFFQLFQRKIIRPNLSQNITPSNSFMVLEVLRDGESLPISEIGRRLHISKSNMSSLIETLESEGKIKRLSDSRDRRINKISITGKGRKFMKATRAKMRTAIVRGLSGIPPQDKGAVHNALREMTRVFSKL